MIIAAVIAFVALMSVIPYVTLRHARRYAIADAALYAVMIALWALGQLLDVQPPASLVFALFVVAKLAMFAVFLSLSDLLRWNANWAGAFAGAIYLILVPHVMQWPVDGDEPYYLLVTESLVRDRDLDLRNQYQGLAQSETRRTDLEPQLGDPVGPDGQQYSRTEPFLSLLLVPGYLILGLSGALATMGILGGLLVRSTMQLFEEQGVPRSLANACYGFFAFGPPVLFYSTRIWPEVPAALFFVESLRAMELRRPVRFILAVLAISLLKVRFIPIAVLLVVLFAIRFRPRWQTVAVAAGVLLVPLLVAFAVTGGFLNVHELWELRPQGLGRYLRGFFGLLLDAQTGILFQAPFYLVGVLALTRWREVPPAARNGLLASLLYLFLLFPREEWHGGWSPAIRYLVVLLPALALAAVVLLKRVSPSLLAMLSVATAALTIHGISFPWRLFHIANGESVLGESLSSRWHADFSRILPSFIRVNQAAIVGAGVFVAVALVIALLRRARISGVLIGATITLAIAGLFSSAMRPGTLVHFEDRHVIHRGGEVFPPQYTVARFRFSGGWRMRAGDEVQFRHAGGPAVIRYAAAVPVTFVIDGQRYEAPATGATWGTLDVSLPRNVTHTVRCIGGEAVLDRIEHR